jgi:WD40 repeat protein
MLSGERVLTASHDGTVKMWDVRTDTCVATVGRCQSAVLCMEYDDSTGILAAAGRDVYVLLTSKCFWCFDSILAQATWVTFCSEKFIPSGWHMSGIFVPVSRCSSFKGIQSG